MGTWCGGLTVARRGGYSQLKAYVARVRPCPTPEPIVRFEKSVIVEDHRPTGGRLLENPEFLRFAAHWGFRIRACRPYGAKTKGKVERPVGYLRSNCLYGRTFLGDGDLADQCTQWLARANR